MTRLTVLAFSILAFLLAWHLRGCTIPDVQTSSALVDTVFIERPLTIRDTIRVRDVVVETVTRFQPVEVERLRVDTVHAPVDLGRYTLAPTRPLHFERGRAVVTTFDPESHAWQQVRYQVPVKRWSVGVTSRLLYVPSLGVAQVSAGPSVRLGGFGIGGGSAFSLFEPGPPVWFGSFSYTLPLL